MADNKRNNKKNDRKMMKITIQDLENEKKGMSFMCR